MRYRNHRKNHLNGENNAEDDDPVVYKDKEYRGDVKNPLTATLPWRFQFYQRIKLFPWWIKYNVGVTKESALKDQIVKLAVSMDLESNWTRRILRHAISEFSKKGLGSDYYGYHNIDHELEATYLTLLAARGRSVNGKNDDRYNNGKFVDITDRDIKYLFVSALFHDYDPLKQFDKPHEESVEWFLRNDKTIKKFVDGFGINLDIVIAIIYRTAYPFRGKVAENAMKRMRDLFESAGVCATTKADNHHDSRDMGLAEHYERLGWFLSVCERMAGYALGDFEHAKKLARANAHALGWHPSLINEESVRYFCTLKDEKEMTQFVLSRIPDDLRDNFYNNVESFREAWEEENRIRSSIRKKEILLLCQVEQVDHVNPNNDDKRGYIIGRNNYRLDLKAIESIRNIHQLLSIPLPLKQDAKEFLESLYDRNTILITLRANRQYDDDVFTAGGLSGEGHDGDIVGFVKGGPLENYKLRRGTNDENSGKRNTAYMEWICIKPGYWGGTGGHLLRVGFLREAKLQGYKFVTSYVHRNVITNRINRGENIQIVQKYDPDKLDYYRIDLDRITMNELQEESRLIFPLGRMRGSDSSEDKTITEKESILQTNDYVLEKRLEQDY
jgi:hypothetical protein